MAERHEERADPEESDGTEVWRLRARGRWEEAAALLAPGAATDPALALRRAALLAERCLFTGAGWADAEDALRRAEAAARDDGERGAAACERGHLAYAATVLGVRDRADEARAALGRAAALLAPGSAGRPLLDFRRGLVAEHLSRDAEAARPAYRRAHDAATAAGQALLRSSTSRHLAGLALRDGDVALAHEGFSLSLRLREQVGFQVGLAPALVALAEVESEREAARLRAEAHRLFHLLGRVPSWLAQHLPA